MKLAITEVSHWHSPEYVKGITRLSFAELVAVSDRQGKAGGKIAKDSGCRFYSDYRKMLDREKIDFLFILGTHRQMPEIMEAAIQKQIPFCVEKPGACNTATLLPVLEKIKTTNLYHCIPFVYRLSPFVRCLLQWKKKGLLGEWISLKFRYLTGPPERYRKWNCPWNLLKKEAGGGTTINLSVHYFDLFRYLTEEEIVEVKGFVSKKRFREEVEDYSLVLLKTDKSTIGEIETGYLSPEGETLDQDNFVVFTEQRKITWNKNILHWKDYSGREGQEILPVDNLRILFVEKTLNSFLKKEEPVATISDLIAVMKIVDQVYKNCFFR